MSFLSGSTCCLIFGYSACFVHQLSKAQYFSNVVQKFEIITGGFR